MKAFNVSRSAEQRRSPDIGNHGNNIITVVIHGLILQPATEVGSQKS